VRNTSTSNRPTDGHHWDSNEDSNYHDPQYQQFKQID